MPQLHALSDQPILRNQERRLGERARTHQIDAMAAIAHAIEQDDIERLKGMARDFPECIAASQNKGETWLMKAVDQGGSAVLPVLAKIEGFGRRDAKGRNALMRAARRGEARILEWLIANGDAGAIDEEGRTALMWAAAHGNALAVELLLPVSDPQAICERGNTALIWAAAGNGPGHALCVALLAPKSDAMAVNAMGHDALWEAIQCGSVNSAQELAPRINWPLRQARNLNAQAQCAQCGAFAVFNALEKTAAHGAQNDLIAFSQQEF